MPRNSQPALVGAIVAVAESLSAPCVAQRSPIGGCWHVTITTPRLAVSCTVDTGRGAGTPLLHWHDAAARLAGHEAWDSVNRAHGCKATTYPASTDALLSRLANGLTAAVSGAAFVREA